MKLAICDDDKKIRELIEESVREVSGDIEIEVFADARGILAPGFEADILFLDIQMPGIDGMNAARMIRADGKKTVMHMNIGGISAYTQNVIGKTSTREARSANAAGNASWQAVRLGLSKPNSVVEDFRRKHPEESGHIDKQVSAGM